MCGERTTWGRPWLPEEVSPHPVTLRRPHGLPYQERGACCPLRGLGGSARAPGAVGAVSFRTTALRRLMAMWQTLCPSLRRRCRSFQAASYSGESIPGPPTPLRSVRPALARPPRHPVTPGAPCPPSPMTPTCQHSAQASTHTSGPGYTANPQCLHRLCLTSRVSKLVSRDCFSDLSI